MTEIPPPMTPPIEFHDITFWDNIWGMHLVLDCASCDKDLIQNAEHIKNFAKDLVKRIDMVAYGEPQVVNFGSGNKAGYTLVQLIETSNICAHFCNDTGDMYLDVFSCKKFNSILIVDTVKEYFRPTTVSSRFLARDAGERLTSYLILNQETHAF